MDVTDIAVCNVVCNFATKFVYNRLLLFVSNVMLQLSSFSSRQVGEINNIAKETMTVMKNGGVCL